MERHVVLKSLKDVHNKNGIPQKVINDALLASQISALEQQDEIHEDVIEIKEFLKDNPSITYLLKYNSTMRTILKHKIKILLFLLIWPFLLPIILHWDIVGGMILKIINLIF